AQNILGDCKRGCLLERCQHIPPEHGMSRADLVIDLHDGEMFIARDRISPIGSSARIGCRRKQFGDIYSRRTDLWWRQAVVHEWRPQKDIPRLTGSGSVRRKIARDHFRSWDEGERAQRALTRNGSLIAGKEKQFVLLDRTTNGPAKLVTF